MTTPSGSQLMSLLSTLQDQQNYQNLHWVGSFQDYLDIVTNNPKVTRNAFQRIYDMIMSYGLEEFIDAKKKLIRYNFFTTNEFDEQDAIFGLEIPLMRLVNFFKAAAHGYGTEKRVLLLHGPVGSAKSTIARRLKRGLERYSRSENGALYTFDWFLGDIEDLDAGEVKDADWDPCPMHEDPLHLIPLEMREAFLKEFNANLEPDEQITITGDLDPSCRYNFRDLMRRYNGDFAKVLRHVRVRRFVFSEQDRVGIGTFQPKDEKNQDSTELTGDINYRKIAIYGSDSDPRAFSFDGEFNIANRGIIEFVEMLKLDTAFLYDLLGASQEHRIKSKKFAQTHIDEVIVGHSVAGNTPIPYRYNGVPGWTTLEQLCARFNADSSGLEVLAFDFNRAATTWTPVKTIFRHRFSGNMLTTSQKWGVVETTPNHSIYSRSGQTFFPEEGLELAAVRWLDDVWIKPEAQWQPIDVIQHIDGFIRDDVVRFANGGKLTKPCQPGWARLNLPRHATQIKAIYDPQHDQQALKDLITVMVWYATEGHINGRNGGIIISQNDRDELERVRQAYANITTAHGSIDAGAKTDNCWRLYLSSQAIAALVKYHCGEHSEFKRLPDFLFNLPKLYQQHAFEELMRTDGSRKIARAVGEVCSDEYRDTFFEYKTLSSLLATQVGTLSTLLGHDYSVYRLEREDRTPAYRVRFVSGSGKRGGRHNRFENRLTARPVVDEWVYDIECEGIHNFVCGLGNVVCHNTNEPEFRKLENNEFMEALKDRTVRIDIPYITRLRDEIRIYEKDFNSENVRVHIAPHTIEVAAMWAILTRLEEPKRANLTLLQKMKLYNGKSLPGFTEDNIKELRKESRREGMEGISPRYIQDKISNALVNYQSDGGINPFMVMNELESGLKTHSLITNEEDRKRYRELLAIVKEEYADIVKNEVQRAISADEEAIKRLCANYIDNIKAYTQREKVRNKFTGAYEEPDERLMRSIEEKIDIPDNRKDDFRREIMNYIGALAIEGKTFDYRTNERLHRALELKLFEDQKDSIKLTSLVSSVVDKDTQEKIDVVKTRLIRDFGYNDQSATDVLNYVASIFARGDATQRK
ncbi:serine/threonine protein kinase [Herpetosiphon sp. NSE202]|uniref:serine/threonine protein kinase n=1 Tax=Herpetosiphon sp. NSE202 TaxID=3351349 RepID=UPI0036414646